MIPLKLELKNFLSYGDTPTTVDFARHSLICLSGKNGNGKSALLDAMTWALWGQARKISGTIKADAGLIRLGQTRMQVSLEFMCAGQRYRVRREFAKTYGKPYAALDFELFDEASAAYVPLSEKNIRVTQAKIEKTVGLDFDTFANSAFLRQGQANEFSQKTPKERKQILGNILGLAHYDGLQKLALDHIRSFGDERKLMTRLCEQATQELAHEQEFTAALTQKNNELQTCTESVETVARNLTTIESEKLTFLEQKYLFDQRSNELKRNQAQEQELLQKFNDLVVVWKRVHVQSLNIPDIKKIEQEYKKLLAEDRAWRERYQQYRTLQEKLLSSKETLQTKTLNKRKLFDQDLALLRLNAEKAKMAYNQLLDHIQQKEKIIGEMQRKIQTYEKDLAGVETESKKFKIFQEQGEQLKKQFEKRRMFYQSLVQQGNWAQRELQELNRKKEIAHDTTNPSCPLCEQVLTVKRKQFLARTLKQQESFWQHRLARITAVMKTLKELLVEQHKQVQQHTFQEDFFKQLAAKKESLEKNKAEIEKELAREKTELDLCMLREKSEKTSVETIAVRVVDFEKNGEALLLNDIELREATAVLQSLEKELTTLAYDKQAHDVLLHKVHECEQRVKAAEDIARSALEQRERRTQITTLAGEIKKIKKVIDESARVINAMKFNPGREQEIDALIKQTKDQQSKAAREKDLIVQQKNTLEIQLQRLEAVKKEQVKREQKIIECDKQSKEYQLLATMFGKDGIQALLIEEAIPEIEQEANALLSKLTDNKSQIFIESLRDLKSGGVRESLDIHISDEAGIRPYEMFSGGEAFRIDFALRIAISKLLARRAGATLQTLIIDEGFGSQDEEGLQRLMDAMYAIQRDFSKIIVVSHLPAFKDNFPVHFVVEKDSLGSQVMVEERG